MELISILGELARAPGAEQARIARVLGLPGEISRAAYTDLFVVKLYPHASVYLSPDGQPGDEVRERIESFWRAAKQPVPDSIDHIATLLQSYGTLIGRATASSDSVLHDIVRHMRHAFFWEYLVSWSLPFLLRVAELGEPAYRAWSALLLDALESEATSVGPAAVLPLYLRSAPPLPGVEEPALLSEALFAPVRSGIILTRADLARCSGELGLRLQVSNRRYTVKAMLAQDLTRVGSWLEREATRQHATLQQLAGVFRLVAGHWLERAQQTADALSALVARYAGAPSQAREVFDPRNNS